MTQLTNVILIITRYSYHWLILCLRKTRIDIVEIRLQVKFTHKSLFCVRLNGNLTFDALLK